MTLVEAGVARGRTVISSFFLLIFAGLVAYSDIPKEASPDVNIPTIYVLLNLSGVSPEDSERLLVRPVEKELEGIEGVKEITATAYQGGGSVVLEFDAGFDSDKALSEVREKVDDARSSLPSEADEPSVHEVNFSLFPILLIGLSGDVGERRLLHIAERLSQEIEALPEVLSADISGKRDEVVEMVIDPVLLESYAISPDQVLRAVRRSNLLVAAGALESSGGRFAVKVPGLIETIEDLETLPIFAEGDAVVTLGDIADIRRTFKDNVSYARLDGDPSLIIELVKRSGENIIDTVDKAKVVVEEERTRFSSEVQITYSQDNSVIVRDRLGDLQNNVISAVLLVMIVVLGALGLRAATLVGITIPGSFLTGILLLYSSGFTVNMVVLFGLTMAVGMLVDGAIVVSEYAERKLAEGLDRQSAYVLAARRMAWPIIASTMTTLAAFMPLLFWPGIVGEFMKFLPLTLIFVLSASLVMALFFLPVLGIYFAAMFRVLVVVVSALLLQKLFSLPFAFVGATGLAKLGGFAGLCLGAFWGYRRFAPFLIRHADTDQQGRSVGKGGTKRDKVKESLLIDLKKLKGYPAFYLKIMNRVIVRPKRVLLIAGGVLVGSWLTYGLFGKGVEFFPDIEPDNAAFLIHARGNLSVDERDYLVRQVEDEILEHATRTGEISAVFSSSGIGDSSDRSGAQDIIGRVRVEFADWQERRPAALIIHEMREKMDRLAGIYVEPALDRAGPPRGKPIHLEIRATQSSALLPSLHILRNYLETIEGVVDIEDSASLPGIEWRLDIDRAQAMKFGTDVSTLGDFVRLVTNGLKISTYRPDDSDDEVDIVMRVPKSYRNITQLDRLRITTSDGEVPVSNFVKRSPYPVTGNINRSEQRRILTLKADVAQGVLADDVLQRLKADIENLDLPVGVDVMFRGQDQDQREASQFLSRAFGIALFMMGLILLTQFNSFYQCLLILSTVIMSTIGVFWGLLITQQPFGIIMSGIGVIALAGIVVNNNIVLIDTFNTIYRQTGNLRLSILQTGAQRLRPVFLTTATTVLGLLPLVLAMNLDVINRRVEIGGPSSQWWQQLSTSVVFGLIFSTVLTLVVTPSALMLVESRALAKRKAGEKVARPGRRSIAKTITRAQKA